jgi:hypothetical protein
VTLKNVNTAKSEDPVTAKLVLVDYREYAKKVADAYAARPSFESQYVSSWKALAEHCKKIFKQIESKVKIEFVEEDPYTSSQEMLREVKEKKLLRIYTGHSEHPVWTSKENHIFRAVHDWYSHILGSGAGGHAFNLRGEYNSYNRHVKLVPENAKLALFTEIVGQASYKQVKGSFPEQKICKLWGFDYINIGKINDVEYQKNFGETKKTEKMAASKGELVMSDKLKGIQSRTEKVKLENKLHKLLHENTKGIFSDKYWTPIKKIVKELTNLKIYPLMLSTEYKGYEKEFGGKEWVFELEQPGVKVGGWYLKIRASFGPSTLDKNGQNLEDRYDLVYSLNWDPKMHHGEKDWNRNAPPLPAVATAASKEKLLESIKDWLNEPKFMKAIPDMISAAKLARSAGQAHGNGEMVKFNSLAINFLEAMQKKDEMAATEAAMKLASEGHGGAFGLDGAYASVEDEKLKRASEAIAAKCMSMHKGDSAWNPICAAELAKSLEMAMGYVNAVKLTQVIENAWKEKQRDLQSLSVTIKEALSGMKVKQ